LYDVFILKYYKDIKVLIPLRNNFNLIFNLFTIGEKNMDNKTSFRDVLDVVDFNFSSILSLVEDNGKEIDISVNRIREDFGNCEIVNVLASAIYTHGETKGMS
jgi:hypothetical protein